MYVTSLFAVLPKEVSMEAIREVETLPRKFKVEAEGAGLSAQVQWDSHLLFNGIYLYSLGYLIFPLITKR